MTKFVMEVIYRHMKDKVIRFIKGKSRSTNSSAFYDETTCSIDAGRAADIIDPDFSLTWSPTTSM